MNKVFFDCETASLPESYLLETFKPTFEPNKTLKDPAKIEADIAAKRQAWLDESALHAERGEILAIGFKASGMGAPQILESEGNERTLLKTWMYAMEKYELSLWCGFNSLSFDLPFLRRRCLILGIPFPFYNRENKWNPWSFATFDAMVDWQCGDRRAPYIGLVALANALGIPAEKDGVGSQFGEIYRTDRPRALKHLLNDVVWTEAVCERLLS